MESQVVGAVKFGGASLLLFKRSAVRNPTLKWIRHLAAGASEAPFQWRGNPQTFEVTPPTINNSVYLLLPGVFNLH